MNNERSYIDFVTLHERNTMTKEVNSIIKDINATTDRTKDILGYIAEEDIKDVVSKIDESIDSLKKLLVKHKLYNI